MFLDVVGFVHVLGTHKGGLVHEPVGPNACDSQTECQAGNGLCVPQLEDALEGDVAYLYEVGACFHW